MSKIPFKVSARTARLIGRENIASSKGAIIELVKNAYDADSSICIVFFDNKFVELPLAISADDYYRFIQSGGSSDLFQKVYQPSNGGFILSDQYHKDNWLRLRTQLRKLCSLYIIDAGEGMTQEVIRNHWMTIGTDNKAYDIFTKSGRVKAGEKGIGRFALDKLGNTAEMITIFDKKEHTDIDEKGHPTNYDGYYWKVTWSDFEGEFKTIDKVKAELNGLNNTTIKKELLSYLNNKSVNKIVNKNKFLNGTILKITELRDDWVDFYVNQIADDLEVLVPTQEISDFSIHLHSTLENDKYGEIVDSVCDDYDYKLVAKADDEQNIKITIHRNEYDVELIPPSLFQREAMQKEDYTLEALKKGNLSIKTTFSKLLPGFSDIDEERVFENIGPFEFTLYFMKKSFTSTDDEKYHYVQFNAKNRKSWLDRFAGIKLFRDNFRVRPYGEVRNSAFDWLGLGARKAQSPAGVSKKEGGYRVNPENVSGSIKISRITNVNFEDKSSREGLQENEHFRIFTNIIASILKTFEEDRSYIARELSELYNETQADGISKAAAEALAKQILADERNKKKGKSSSKSTDSSDAEIVLAKLNEDKTEEIEKLKDEQILLRSMASSGLVLASFSHDLSKLNQILSSRVNKLRKLILKEIA